MTVRTSHRRSSGAIRRLPSGRWQPRFTTPDGAMRTIGTFAAEAEADQALAHADARYTFKRGIDAMTVVRQRLVREQKARRGRRVDPAWANRRLLLRGANTLSQGGWARLEKVFRHDDPTDQRGAACGVKVQLRRLLKITPCRTVVGGPNCRQAHRHRHRHRHRQHAERPSR